jgi:AcrR family transcriptional regulator
MSRWEPNARGRLEQAALDLYLKQGYEKTTVLEIAERAGLTERTFFRYFPDKREVLFGGQEALRGIYVSAIESAPDDVEPIDAVVAALLASVPVFHERHQIARRRQAVIAQDRSLQEREIMKRATLASAMEDALKRRGVDDLDASLAGELGAWIFRTAFARWISEPVMPDLSALIRASALRVRGAMGNR